MSAQLPTKQADGFQALHVPHFAGCCVKGLQIRGEGSAAWAMINPRME